MNAKKNNSSTPPIYLLGIAVMLVMLVGVFVISEQNPEMKQKIMRSLAQEVADPLQLNQWITQLTAEDRRAFGRQITADRCYNSTTIPERGSCPVETWPNGDPSFNWHRFYNLIPRDTRAVVKIECNPQTGQFETNVQFPNVCPNRCDRNGQNCQPTQDCGSAYFQTPYPPPAPGVRTTAPFSNEPQNWITTPGAYNELDFTHFRGRLNGGLSDAQVSMTETSGVVDFGNSFPMSEYHFVRGEEGQRSHEWAGHPLGPTLLLDTQNGIYIHAAHPNNVDGFGQSRGCIRIHPHEMQGLYNLVRRIGTANVRYEFSGYGPYDRRLGGPACAAPNRETWLASRRSRPNERQWLQTSVPQSTALAQRRQSCLALRGLERFFHYHVFNCDNVRPRRTEEVEQEVSQ
jgi:hypothetical protein